EKDFKEKKIKSPTKDIAKEFETGFGILLRAVEKPMKQIIDNAGIQDGGIVVSKIKEEVSKNPASKVGFNVSANEIVGDMLKKGIIDPVKVTRTALQNSASAAAMFLTTEAAVAEIPKEKPEMPAGGGMPGMGY
ncbi:MAG TPA: hypothetical protein ENH22_00555, partial [Candidatus Campbellbacteria bacterium]|nr:hypothetical protein [Candidatus Campbellbacteria bacterium]